MASTVKSTARGLFGIAATITLAVLVGPYIRTPTGARQLDQNTSGAIQVVERIFDQCNGKRELSVPSFRTWIPKSVMDKVSNVSVTTGDVFEDVPFSSENCASMSTLKQIGKPTTCVMACTDRACLLAATPHAPGHFGTSKVDFLDGSGKSLLSETFNLSEVDAVLPETIVSSEGHKLSVRATANGERLKGMVHFPTAESAPTLLNFNNGVAETPVPDGANSYMVFIQKPFSTVEVSDLYLGSVQRDCANR